MIFPLIHDTMHMPVPRSVVHVGGGEQLINQGSKDFTNYNLSSIKTTITTNIPKECFCQAVWGVLQISSHVKAVTSYFQRSKTDSKGLWLLDNIHLSAERLNITWAVLLQKEAFIKVTVTIIHTHLLCVSTAFLLPSFQLMLFLSSYTNYTVRTRLQMYHDLQLLKYQYTLSSSTSLTWAIQWRHTRNGYDSLLWGNAHRFPDPPPGYPNPPWPILAADLLHLHGCNRKSLETQCGSDLWYLLSDKPVTCYQSGSL